MKKKCFKILSLFLSFSTIFTSIQPSYAYNMENNNSAEMIEYQNSNDEDFSSSLNVFAELSSIYKVTIPKTVVLSGESKDATYFVKVEGDIAGYEQISVIPDESFNLYTKKKDPQKAFVSQDKTIWHVSDFDIDANGTIKANTITAGKWSGVFYFNINLEDGEKVAGDIIIPPDLPLDDDYRLIIEKISDAPGLYDDNFTLILPWPEIAKRIEGGETISQIVNSCPGGIYLSIPQGTTTIPTNYLPETNIKYIYVPDTVITIQTTSCPGSPIKGVFLPKSTKVEPGAFDNTPAGENKQVYVGGQRIVDTVININELPERIEDIKDEDALILEKGCKYQITALYNFYDDVTKQSTIKSSNPDIVRFVPDCTLEALEVGTSIISGKYFGPLGERNAYLLVKVIDTGYSKGSIPSNTHKHTVGPLQEENKVLATCTKDGHVDQVFYCSDCNKELGRRTVPLYATGHVAGEWVIVKEATENETGLKEQRCMICGELLKSEAIEKLPNTDKHTDVKYVYKNKIEPTCTENGSQDKIAICNVCGKEVEKTTEILPATGHTKDEYKIVRNATCSEKGLKEQRCIICGELLDSEEIPMTQHIEKSAVKENEVPATCTKDGSYDEVVYCSVCNAEISKTVVKIPALGHDYKEAIINPTHKEKGYTLHTCMRCGDTYKDNETDVIAHTYDSGKVTKEATCTEDGIKTYTCSCGNVKTEIIPKLGHNYKETIIAPTCTANGYTKHVCNRCGDSYEDNIVSKLGHDYKEGVCTRCGDTLPALSVTASGFTGDYDSKAHSITVTSAGNTIQYSTDNATWTTTNPTFTDAGTYTVYYKVSKPTYKTAIGNQKVIINKANGYINTKPTAKILTFNGGAQQLITAGNDASGTIQYSLDNETWSTSVPTGTDAKTYTVYYKVDASSNYNVVDSASINVTISKANSSVKTAPTAKTLTFNNADQELINAGAANNGTMQYKLNSDGTYETSIPKAKNAGSYTIYYKVVGNNNYNDVAEKSITVTIGKANGSITAPTAKTLTYTGSAQQLINAGSTSTGTIQYKLGTGSYGTTIPTATNPGTYTIYYKVVGNGNYNDVTENSLTVTIDKATPIVTAPTAKTLTYTGSAQQLINAGKTTGGTIQYRLGTGSYGTAIPTATNVGTYIVYYKIIGNTYYNDVAEKSITVTIKQEYIDVELNSNTLSQMGYTIDTANHKLKKNNAEITSFNIPEYYTYNDQKYRITSIGKSVFANMTSLQSITIPNTVTYIGNLAFSNTGITSITIPSNVESLGKGYKDPGGYTYVSGYGAFYKCKNLKTITITGGKLTKIADCAFEDCNALTTVKIGNSVETIGNMAFDGCSNLTSITLPTNLKFIDENAFCNCINLVTFNANSTKLETLGYYVFQKCSKLQNVYLPSTLKTIEESVFLDCSALKTITIPKNVTTIEPELFYGCDNITSVKFANTSGWYVTKTKGASSGTNISVTNTTTNKDNFINNYHNYYWYRK